MTAVTCQLERRRTHKNFFLQMRSIGRHVKDWNLRRVIWTNLRIHILTTVMRGGEAWANCWRWVIGEGEPTALWSLHCHHCTVTITILHYDTLAYVLYDTSVKYWGREPISLLVLVSRGDARRPRLIIISHNLGLGLIARICHNFGPKPQIRTDWG